MKPGSFRLGHSVIQYVLIAFHGSGTLLDSVDATTSKTDGTAAASALVFLAWVDIPTFLLSPLHRHQIILPTI